MNTTTKKLSTLRMGTAALAGTVGLAVVGAVAPPIAFADSLHPAGTPTNQPAHYSQWLAIFVGLFLLALAGAIYLRRKLAKFHLQHYYYFVLAALFLAHGISELRAGKPFFFHLVLVVVALFAAIRYRKLNRQLKR